RERRCGPIARAFLLIDTFGPDGRVTHTDGFDADRHAEALARFDELAAPPLKARATGRRVPRNDATLYMARLEAAVAARDLQAVGSLLGAMQAVDHTASRRYDTGEFLAVFRWMIERRARPHLAH